MQGCNCPSTRRHRHSAVPNLYPRDHRRQYRQYPEFYTSAERHVTLAMTDSLSEGGTISISTVVLCDDGRKYISRSRWLELEKILKVDRNSKSEFVIGIGILPKFSNE